MNENKMTSKYDSPDFKQDVSEAYDLILAVMEEKGLDWAARSSLLCALLYEAYIDAGMEAEAYADFVVEAFLRIHQRMNQSEDDWGKGG